MTEYLPFFLTPPGFVAALGAIALLALALGIAIGRHGRSAMSHALASAEQAAARVPDLEMELGQAQDLLQIQREDAVRLSTQLAERERALIAQKQDLEQQFGNLAGQVLRQSQESFHHLAKQNFEAQRKEAHTAMADLVKPMAQKLADYQQRLREVEAARTEAYGSLRNELKSVVQAQGQVAREAGRLATALKDGSGVRGRWGEQQLRRIVELAGMTPYVDFDTQVTVKGADGQQAKPDLVIRLPGDRVIIVDSKVPMSAYHDARNETDETRRLALYKDHAKQVRAQVRLLAAKSYADHWQGALDSVVMFLPTEDLAAAAWEHDQSLYEDAFKNRILIATPTTLFALAKAVAHVWRNEKAARNAHEVAKLGQELHDRLATMAGHIRKLGGSLEGANRHYNAFIGSLERKVLPKARQFKQLETVPETADDLDLAAAEQPLRSLQAAELSVAEPGKDQTPEPDYPAAAE